MLTREQLKQMSEDQLRQEVLIPLFRAMGYRDVMKHHGGTGEQGKDIVMWKASELRDRVNYAIVVKRKVNGKASGAGSAGETVAQVQQAFATPFRDLKTGEERRVDHCLIVVANEITKQFLEKVAPVLEADRLARATDYVDIDTLWEWVKKHLPEKTPFACLEEFQSLLTEDFPGLAAEAQVTPSDITLRLNPTDPTKQLPPASMSFEVSAEGEAGKETRDQYERFLKTGAGFTVNKGQIKKIEISDFLKKFSGIDAEKLFSFQFTPTPSPPTPWNFKRVCNDGTVALLQRVELRNIQGGTEESTLTNEAQGVPWIFTIVARTEGGLVRIQLSYRTRLMGANCRQVLDWLQFQRALARPGKLVLEHAETGIEIPSLEDNGSGEEPEAALTDLVEMLAYIQARTAIVIAYPGTFSQSDVDAIEKLFQIVKTGRISLRSFTGIAERERILSKAEKLYSPGALNIEFQEETHETCLGMTFGLGPSRIVGYNVVLDDDSLTRIKAELENQTAVEGFELTFQPVEGGSLDWIFPQWLNTAGGAV